MPVTSACPVASLPRPPSWTITPKHAVVGTATRHVDVDGRILYDFHPPTEHSDIVRGLRYQAALMHPSIMLRLKAVQACGLYENRFPGGEDYDLFFRLAKNYKLANLQEIYVVKETNPSSITGQRKKLRGRLGRLRLLAWHFDPGSVHSYLGIVANALAILAPHRLDPHSKTLAQLIAAPPSLGSDGEAEQASPSARSYGFCTPTGMVNPFGSSGPLKLPGASVISPSFQGK